MTNAAPSMAALKQIGDILYELKAHPQFQTEITNVAMERGITDPADLRALIEARLQLYQSHLGNPPQAAGSTAYASASGHALAPQTPVTPRATGKYMASVPLGVVEHLAAPIFPGVDHAAVAAVNPAVDAEALAAQTPKPITFTTSGFMGSASTGGIDYFSPPSDLPDVRTRAAE